MPASRRPGVSHQHGHPRRQFLRRLGAAALVGSAGWKLSGCGPQPGAPASPTSPGPAGRRVGVALASMNHNFFLGMRQGVEDALREAGLQAEIVDADNSATAQQQQVDQFIQKGVHALIMVPVDADQAVNPVRAANAARIPVFCIDRRVTAEGAEVTCTVETDNIAMGEEAARFALRLLCQRHGVDPDDAAAVRSLRATVVHLWGLEAASSARDRARGFENVFNTRLTPQVRVLKAVGDFNARKSQEVLAPELTARPEIELVYCHNDDNAIGALNAVKDVKRGREPVDDPRRVFIVGMDGNRAAVEAIRAGEMEGTVSQEPIEMGEETVRQVKLVLEGAPPTSRYIAIRHHLVTRKEAEEGRGKLWCDLLRGGAGSGEPAA